MKKRMNEKVLGFKEREAFAYCDCHYRIDKTKLVPVISLAWLEKWCKRKQVWSAHMAVHRKVVAVDDLLSWVKKNSEAKKKVAKK